MRRIIFMLKGGDMHERGGKLPFTKRFAIFLAGISAFSIGLYLITDSPDVGFLVGMTALLMVAVAMWLWK